VEKTRQSGRCSEHQEKHLHGRGEDAAILVDCSAPIETPPRAWRRPGTQSPLTVEDGNTSTGVEKTGRHAGFKKNVKKHLHGRGED